MPKIRNIKIEDVETVAKMVALDYDDDSDKGYRDAREHLLDHLRIVPKTCYVVENDDGQIVAAMVMHPQEKVFEIEDFHVKDVQRNKEALALLKAKLLECFESVQTEILCCPCAFKRLIKDLK